MVKVQGQNSNRNTVKQTVKNSQTFSGDGDVACNLSLVPGDQDMRLQNGIEFFLSKYSSTPVTMFVYLYWIWLGIKDINRFTRRVAYEVIPGDQEHFDSLAWPCMIVRWPHWRHQWSHLPCFSQLSVWPSSGSNFDLRPSPSDDDRILWKSLKY